MKNDTLKDFVLQQLEEIKAKDITVIEMPDDSSITDYMIIASGTSSRHVKSIAILLIKSLKENDRPPIGVEGEDASEWILVDCGDVIVHIMQPSSREYYQLEKLWQ
ncbi:MAG: ribosome silencing factor [Enterobacterales bacterium]|nr:ribosome silencing factor [Enterobacterales bacterium]